VVGGARRRRPLERGSVHVQVDNGHAAGSSSDAHTSRPWIQLILQASYGRTSHRGNPTSLLEVLRVDWWMYLLMAAAAIVLMNVLLVVALVVFRRDGELTD
jgi:hypothetical protein